jgi:hypothetical protein
MASIQQLITNLEETIVYLKTQLPKEEVKPVKADKKKKEDVEPVEKKVAAKKEPVEKKVAAKKETAEKKAEPEKKVSAKKAEPKEKNLNRMTPAIKTELTKVLKTHDVELTEELRKEFIEYVNGMETDAYAASNLTTHMEAFAKSKAGGGEDEEEVVEDDAPVTKTIKSPYAGQQDPPDLKGRSNAAGPLDLHSIMRIVPTEKLTALKKTEILKPLGDGNYWHPKDGVYVFEDTDDDVDEFPLNGNTYVASKSNKRVYKMTDDKDIFVGFLGVGEFKDVKV